MKVIADTNVLVRLLVGDDPAQQATAVSALAQAATIAISTVSLCELSGCCNAATVYPARM